MFGDYSVYWDGKVVGLICDDQLFIKPTEPSKAFVKNYLEGLPYPGAKPYLLIEGDDREWMVKLFRVTATALPPAKKKIKSHRM
jgi:DNA transformation protein